MADKGFLDSVLDNIGVPMGGGKGFEAGSHVVEILLAEEGTKTTKDGTVADIITVHVKSVEDSEVIGESTLWFHTEGGAKMAVTKVGGLLVHNSPEDKKDKIRELVRQAFASANSSGDLKTTQKMCLKLLGEKLVGKEGFALAEPQGDYSTTKYVDLWHYEQKPSDKQDEAADKNIVEKGEEVTETIELPEGW